MPCSRRRRRRRILVAVPPAALLCLAPALPASAQWQRVPCGDGNTIIADLQKQWGEEPAVMALDAAGRWVRVLVNPETGAWTMLVTGAGELTCLVATGQAWETLSPPPGDPS